MIRIVPGKGWKRRENFFKCSVHIPPARLEKLGFIFIQCLNKNQPPLKGLKNKIGRVSFGCCWMIQFSKKIENNILVGGVLYWAQSLPASSKLLCKILFSLTYS